MSGKFFGLIGILPDPVEQTIDENIVKSSDSLMNKTQEKKISCPIIKTLEFINPIISDERSVISNALIGGFQKRQNLFSGLIKFFNFNTAFDLASDFTQSKILRFAFEIGYFI